MRRVINNLILFIFSISLLICIYVGVFKISVAAICVLLLFFAIYGLCMGSSWKSMEKLKEYENKLIHFKLEPKDDIRILLFSLKTLFPTYFCVFLVSLIPLYTYEIWFITIFPCILLNSLPATSVLDEYYVLTHKKFPFVTLFLILIAIFSLAGIIISSLVLKKFV